MDTNSVINISAFSIFTLLWIGFLAALLFNQQILHEAWRIFRHLPIPAQIIVAFVALPVVVGLWIWHISWPTWLRYILILALAWVTIYTFFPRLPVV